MPGRKPLVIVTRKLPDVIETRMRELFDARLSETDRPLDKAQLIEAMKSCDILVPTVTDRIDSAVLAHAGDRLRLIANYGTGVDNIDVEAATRRGRVVVNAPASNSVAVAELTIGLIMALARQVPQAHASLQTGKWERNKFMGFEVRGKTLGLIGLGRIEMQCQLSEEESKLYTKDFLSKVTAVP